MKNWLKLFKSVIVVLLLMQTYLLILIIVTMLLGAKFRKKYCIADDFREEFALQQENIWLMT